MLQPEASMDSPEQIIDQVRFGHRPDDGFAIRAKGLCKTYGDGRKQPAKQALKSVDIDIPIGQIYGLLGPNGAGKSTFINIMAGTVVKTAGSISIWGTDIDADPRQARANIGIVPQELNIDAYFTPRQTLEMTAGLFGVPKDQRRSDEFLEMVGLTDQAHTYARRLSGGMRRRLLVAKAMVHSPPILVLDEPTAGVDVALRQKLWDNILMLNAHGVTIVLTTHYLHEAETLCDHIAILDEGRIITSQPKKTLIAGASRKEMRMTLAPSVATSAPSTAAPTPGATSTQNTRPTALPETLQALGVKWQDDYLVARYDPQKINAATIIASVTKAGFSIEEISTVEPDLEDVFLDLTGK
jgi:ABC-2 type transport system ATP-binding protein